MEQRSRQNKKEKQDESRKGGEGGGRAAKEGWGTGGAGGTGVCWMRGGDIIACKEAVCKGHRCRAEGVIFHFLWEGGKERTVVLCSIPLSVVEWL